MAGRIAMAHHAKHYYLFSIRVWSVIVEVEEPEEQELELEEEDSESGSASLEVQSAIAGDTIPIFGFTPFTPHYLEEEE